MKNVPWKGIFIGCVLMTVLVIARCIGTICMSIYYKLPDWMDRIWADPWTYVGIAAGCVGVVACVMWRLAKKK